MTHDSTALHRVKLQKGDLISVKIQKKVRHSCAFISVPIALHESIEP